MVAATFNKIGSQPMLSRRVYGYCLQLILTEFRSNMLTCVEIRFFFPIDFPAAR